MTNHLATGSESMLGTPEGRENPSAAFARSAPSAREAGCHPVG